jgi:archaellum component FlaD/FlaE
LIEKELENDMSNIMMLLEDVDYRISEEGLENEQFVLNFYDQLNAISVKK